MKPTRDYIVLIVNDLPGDWSYESLMRIFEALTGEASDYDVAVSHQNYLKFFMDVAYEYYRRHDMLTIFDVLTGYRGYIAEPAEWMTSTAEAWYDMLSKTNYAINFTFPVYAKNVAELLKTGDGTNVNQLHGQQELERETEGEDHDSN